MYKCQKLGQLNGSDLNSCLTLVTLVQVQLFLNRKCINAKNEASKTDFLNQLAQNVYKCLKLGKLPGFDINILLTLVQV